MLLAVGVLLVAAAVVVLATRDGGDRSGDDARPRAGAGARAQPAFPSARARRSFDRLSASVGGELAVATAPVSGGTVSVLGEIRRATAWSTIKVPLVLAAMRERGGHARLSPAERASVDAALTRSDNAAAQRLFDGLAGRHGGVAGASRAIDRVLRDAGDDRTTTNTKPDPRGFTTFGQTDWSPAAATAFFRALARGRVAPREDTRAVLLLLQAVVPDQRWGIGQTGFGPRPAFKGGWGPEPGGGYVVRQSGVVQTHGGRRYAVTIAVRTPAGGGDPFGEGRRAVTQTARWLEGALAAR